MKKTYTAGKKLLREIDHLVNWIEDIGIRVTEGDLSSLPKDEKIKMIDYQFSKAVDEVVLTYPNDLILIDLAIDELTNCVKPYSIKLIS
tara:strand:+ start:557 stop:823 length:267 start_codon:yes stop_codon:yes gene_type:complete